MLLVPPASQICLFVPGHLDGTGYRLGMGCPWISGVFSTNFDSAPAVFSLYSRYFSYFFYFSYSNLPPGCSESLSEFRNSRWQPWYFWSCLSPALFLPNRALTFMLGPRPHVRTAAMVSIPKGLWTWICIPTDLCCPHVWLSCHRW